MKTRTNASKIDHYLCVNDCGYIRDKPCEMISAPTIFFERQPDGQYLAYDDDGPIVWHESAAAAASLAKIARPNQPVVVKHLRLVED